MPSRIPQNVDFSQFTDIDPEGTLERTTYPAKYLSLVTGCYVLGRTLLEQATLEGYRSNQLSRGQVAEMLGLDWAETEEFLAKHHCDRHYDIRDLEEDRRNLDQILGPA